MSEDLSLEEAAAAVHRCSFTVTDPEAPDFGREITHCFKGPYGADWDTLGALQLLDSADRMYWADTLLGVCLVVEENRSDAPGEPERLHTYVFDTVRP